MRVLVLMDPWEKLNPKTDTTLVIVEEARARGHEVAWCEPRALFLDGPEVWADLEGGPRPLAAYDAVLMRKDPPFDLDYYFATLLLERARGRTLLVNDPRGLRDANEKLYIFNFPELIAPTRVLRRVAALKQWLTELGGEMIVKPLDACGGAGVFHVRAEDRNTNAILETCTANETKWVMAQKYLPEARQGDKRILLLDGEPLGAVLRVPRADETRGNLHVGGTATRTALTERERAICAQVGARLKQEGLYFVGLDVIGGMLTEVNVTSPTGIQEIDHLEGTQLEARVVDWLERAVAARGA